MVRHQTRYKLYPHSFHKHEEFQNQDYSRTTRFFSPPVSRP